MKKKSQRDTCQSNTFRIWETETKVEQAISNNHRDMPHPSCNNLCCIPMRVGEVQGRSSKFRVFTKTYRNNTRQAAESENYPVAASGGRVPAAVIYGLITRGIRG